MAIIAVEQWLATRQTPRNPKMIGKVICLLDTSATLVSNFKGRAMSTCTMDSYFDRVLSRNEQLQKLCKSAPIVMHEIDMKSTVPHAPPHLETRSQDLHVVALPP